MLPLQNVTPLCKIFVSSTVLLKTCTPYSVTQDPKPALSPIQFRRCDEDRLKTLMPDDPVDEEEDEDGKKEASIDLDPVVTMMNRVS